MTESPEDPEETLLEMSLYEDGLFEIETGNTTLFGIMPFPECTDPNCPGCFWCL